ncbi:MAG: zf-HC2 domain-containing protein [Terracidiphilus sp.]|jgi:hypothetical protein
MAERTQFPNSPACGAWETLLTDALDGLLKPEDEATFSAHKAVCPACAALYEEARKGREWLEFLSPEPEAPEGLLERILARTGPGHAARGPLPAMVGSGVVPAFVPPLWQKPGFFTRMRYALQPRLLMTAAGAFFSIALTLNLAGVRLTTLRLADLRPVAVRSYMERQLTMASVPIVRYYDHLRFVYEVESRVRQLRSQSEGSGNENTTPGGNEDQRQGQPATPGETKQNPGKNDGGGRLDPRQEPDNTVAQPASGAMNDFVETSFHLQDMRRQSDSSAKRARERGRVWIA